MHLLPNNEKQVQFLELILGDKTLRKIIDKEKIKSYKEGLAEGIRLCQDNTPAPTSSHEPSSASPSTQSQPLP